MKSATKLYAWLTVLATVLFLSPSAFATPTGHILRIDPRAGVSSGSPLITTIIETVQFKSMSEVITAAGCGKVNGDAVLDCISNAVEAKNQMWTAFQFPQATARLLVHVDGSDQPATLDSAATWAQSTKDPLVGTAWLIALDASSGMNGRYSDAREVANQFIAAMGPNDIAKLVIFDDRTAPFVANSQWIAAAKKTQLIQMLTANPNTSPSHQQARPLFSQIEAIAQSFGDLGNAGTGVEVPYHQAMVLLSNGAGREDAANVATSGDALKQFFDNGRFPANNPLAPKTPLPVIAIYFPSARGFTNDQLATSDMQFMEELSNPEIGGFFDIVRTGQGVTKATAILTNVKARYNGMYVVKWRLSCLETTPAQTFNLIFGTGSNAIQPDGSFSQVPIGVDPTQWPLDINLAQTKADAETNPVHPGGTVRVFGNFCWGGDKTRAEAYFVPAGTNPNQNVSSTDPEQAKKVMQQLIVQNLHGTATEATATSVTLNVPDEQTLLEGEGDNMVTHLVLYDNKAQRASGVTAATVITLKAGKKPFNLPIILGAAGIVVVILLLVVVVLRGGGGGGKNKRGGNPPPQPVVAGGYGAPPAGGGYGGPPQGGGGYGAPPGGGGYGGPPQGGGGYGAAPADPYAAPVQAYAPPAPIPAPVPAPAPVAQGGANPLAVGERADGSALPQLQLRDDGDAGSSVDLLLVRTAAPEGHCNVRHASAAGHVRRGSAGGRVHARTARVSADHGAAGETARPTA